MRTLARTFLTGALAVGLATGMLPAGATHNTDLHSPNVQLIDSESQTAATNSDLAFWGNRLYAANYSGFRIFDITNGANPTLVNSVACNSVPSGQHDISVWNNDGDAQADLLFLSVDGPRVATAPNTDPTACAPGSTGPVGATNQEVAWEGVRVFDINNEAAPTQIAAVPTDCGSHTHTLVPTDDGVGAPAPGTSLYLYISSYPSSNQTNHTDFVDLAGTSPQGAPFPPADRVAGQRNNGTDCLEPEPRPDGEPGDWTAGQGHNKISIVKLNLSNPAAVDDPVLETDGPGGFSAASCPGAADNCVVYPQVLEVGMPLGTRVTHLASPGRTIEFTACHDISVFIELQLAAGSCWDEGILWDISNPESPDFLRRIRINEVDLLFHSVTFSWDGKLLAWEDEAGGGTDDRCRSSGDLQGRMWFTNPDLNILGSFKIPRPQAKPQNCTAHLYNFIPQTDDRDILVSAWYQGATSVADATQPALTKEIGYYDVQGGPAVTDDSNVWASYWYNGYIYVNDIQRGLDTLAFNDARKENAVTLPFFNPQTQMNTIAQNRPKCGKQDATMWGTSGNDALMGTSGKDVIAGLGGNDTIRSLGGNDRVCGGSGKDKIKGASGKDKLYGEQQNDSLNGGAGKDFCHGGPGKDKGKSCEKRKSIP